ncbi:MAG: glycosyltransferase [Myxococcota bacterium]
MPRTSSTVVVPCFNEARRIELMRFGELTEQGLRVLFVDDGSRDETRQVLERGAAAEPGFSVLVLEQNVGKGEAVRQGLLAAIAAGAERVGYLDADLATPPSEMLRLFDALGPDVEVALGSRVSLLGRHIERSPARHYLGRVFATAASLALGLRVYDTQCGAKAFRVTPALEAALASPFRSRWVFDVELIERLLAGDGFVAERMIEVPLREWRDVRGSKLSAAGMARAATDLLALALRRRR